jgi:hypothetical protein
MINQEEILKKRLLKLKIHYSALREYKLYIEKMLSEKDIYDEAIFLELQTYEKAVLEAYLKRFASIQDFLGDKIFNLLFQVAGISCSKMSEVLYNAEREKIIDSLQNWIELREIRNELEHDYPDKLRKALEDLKFCVNSFDLLETYYSNSLDFAKRYINEII